MQLNRKAVREEISFGGLLKAPNDGARNQSITILYYRSSTSSYWILIWLWLFMIFKYSTNVFNIIYTSSSAHYARLNVYALRPAQW